MTLREMYDEARKEPTPAVAFIQEVMAVTQKTEVTVRRWLSGEVVPDWKSHVRLTPCDKVRLTPENN